MYALDYNARTYREGDEKEFVKLFNECYQDFAGFTPRTVEYWMWFCKLRPGVSPEGMIVVEKNSQIVGYTVVGKSGDIYELCYDSAHDVQTIVSKLLERAIKYVKEEGGDSVALNVPRDDLMFQKACREMGFGESPIDTMMIVRVYDFPRLVSAIIGSKEATTINDEVFHIKIERERSKIGETPLDTLVTIEVKQDKFYVKEGHSGKTGIVIDTDFRTMAAIVFGVISIPRAILCLKLKIRPLRKLPTALKLLSLLSVRDPWFEPRGTTV